MLLQTLIKQNTAVAEQSRAEFFDAIRSKRKALYVCSSCKRERLYQDRRVIRDGDKSTVICKHCFKLKETHA